MRIQETEDRCKRILFVDDDPNVLHGIERILFEMEDEWETAFAGSGRQALEFLQQEPFDVIVSDMRMPEMDGAELLSIVSERFPHMARIVLSGQSDLDLIVKSVKPAHQYLAKPCTADKLNETLMRAFAVRDLLADPMLLALVSKLTSVPSMPVLYHEVMLEMQSPDFRLTRIGEIISQDAGMTAKVLQLVNSAFFGLAVNVTSPVQAAKMLGADILRGLILTVKIFSEFKGTPQQARMMSQMSEHCLLVASLAREVARFEGQSKDIVGDAFIAGVTHDIGKLILAQNLPEEFEKVCAYARENRVASVDAEREMLGSTHPQVGAYLMGLWGLPAAIVDAVAFHHQPSLASSAAFSPLTATHIANCLISDEPMDRPYLEQLSLADHLDDWTALADG